MCSSDSDLQHLLMDAIMTIGAKVRLVLILTEFSHRAQVTRFAGIRVEHQILRENPERKADGSVVNFTHYDPEQKQRADRGKLTFKHHYASHCGGWRRWEAFIFRALFHIHHFCTIPVSYISYNPPILTSASMLQWNFPLPPPFFLNHSPSSKLFPPM